MSSSSAGRTSRVALPGSMGRLNPLKKFEANAMRKRTEFNLVELEKLAAMQATDEEIAAWFDVSQKTVQRRKKSSAEFRETLQKGRAKGRISVRRNLFELSNHNVAASIFLAKNLLGYKNVVECIREDGTPIGIERVNIKRLTDEELAEYERLLKKATDPQSDEG